ncbi:MAG: hypothetical protein AABY22_09755 [Nanoarchaeota archaeon]
MNPSQMMSNSEAYSTVRIEDVKEFIRLLKEENYNLWSKGDFRYDKFDAHQRQTIV